MSATYTEIKRITGTNKVYAKMALDTLTETCWWIDGSEGNIVYLRTRDNDWVAIPDVYCDEGTAFTTTRGNSVALLGGDGWGSYTATEAE